MIEGEVTASVMGLLSLELPFTVCQGDKVKELYLKLWHSAFLYLN